MKTTSSRALIGITALSIVVALGFLCTSMYAASRAEAFAQEATALQRQLFDAQRKIIDLTRAAAGAVKREELFIRVRDTSKKRSVSRECRNYGNVKALPNGERWKGQIGIDRQGHVIFASEAYGLRACALTLLAYERKHGVKTIRQLLARYCEGNREQYEAFLCKGLRLKPTQTFSIRARLSELLPLMVRYETGEPMPEDVRSVLQMASL